MLPRIGKVDRAVFDKIIFPRLGKKDYTVRLGPQHGVDAAVIDLPDGKVMVVAEDPTFGTPVTMPYFGWATVHICASDVAVLGVRPRYMTISLLLPPGTEEATLSHIWQQIDEECRKLDIAIVGGHTGVYPGIAYPLNGGCAVIGIGTKEQLTPANNARPGDSIIMTKGPALQATSRLIYQAEKEIAARSSPAIAERAKARFFDTTVVKDAAVAARYAHAMHDATEGGLLNGVFEIAAASGTGVTVYEEKVYIPEEVQAVCGYFNINPLISISEGTLIIAAPPPNVPPLLIALKEAGIPAWEIGEITTGERTFVHRDGTKEELNPVSIDPYWELNFRTVGRK